MIDYFKECLMDFVSINNQESEKTYEVKKADYEIFLINDNYGDMKLLTNKTIYERTYGIRILFKRNSLTNNIESISFKKKVEDNE